MNLEMDNNTVAKAGKEDFIWYRENHVESKCGQHLLWQKG